MLALTVFPFFSSKFTRKALYRFATGLVVFGYLVFYFAPMDMVWIGVAAMLLFVGQAFIQLLVLMFMTDTVEYGQWKLGKRNESITFSVQPFINKIGGALANGIVGMTLVLSGINSAATPEDVTPGGITMMKVAMIFFPLACILLGYLVYLLQFKIDEKRFAEIITDLKARGDIAADAR